MNDEDTPGIVEATRAITPARIDNFIFKEHEILSAQTTNGQGFVVVASLCEAFHIGDLGQRQRIKRTRLFNEQCAYIYFPTPKGERPKLCMNIIAVPAFLMGVETERVGNPEAQRMLEAFQEEGMVALAEHFGISERGEIRFLRESINWMVLQQIAYEDRVEIDIKQMAENERKEREEKVNQIREAFVTIRERVKLLERRTLPGEKLTEPQLGQIKQTIMVLGALMIESGRNLRPWQAIYSDITLQFGFARVEDITQEALPGVFEFLDAQIAAFRALVLHKRSGQ